MKVYPDLKYFSALSDLLLQSIRNQQTNVSLTLSDFFYNAFRQVRDQHINEPVIYPAAYYEVVHKAIEELAIIKEKRNYILEHRTSGEIWLLGELQGSEISEETYYWMWRNLLIALRYQQDDLIMNHWITCHQFYSYNLRSIHKVYDKHINSQQISNQKSVDKRFYERKRFIEFHNALGGLLMYGERYSCIKRIFNHTQSQPPKYELLPETMFEIFRFYFDVRDPYELNYTWIPHRYPFPETSGINSDSVSKKWIMSYLAVLFLRQYNISQYMTISGPLDYPAIPSTQGEIKQWIEGLHFFKSLISEHLKNSLLISTLKLEFITPEWCIENEKPYPLSFIDNFKSKLEQAYEINAVNTDISPLKISEFEKATKESIEETLKELQKINNILEITDQDTDKWYVSGQRMVQDRDAFSDNPEVHHLNYESFLASLISKNIREGIGETFGYKKTQAYLFQPEEIFKAIDKLNIDEKYILINFGVNIDYHKNQLNVSDLTETKYKGIDIHYISSSYNTRESFFIVKKTDLPNIKTLPIDKETIKKYKLKKISDILNLYSSVIDLNLTTEEIFNECKQDKSEDELKKSVLLSIIISTEFKWKKNIELVQLRQNSDFFQEGITNNLDEVKPINYRNSND